MIDSKKINELGLKFAEDKTEESFNNLYKELSRLFWNYVYKNFKNISYQNLRNVHSFYFSNLWEKIDQFDKSLPFSNWAIASLKNECLQHFRTRMSGRKYDKFFVSIDKELGTFNHKNSKGSDRNTVENYDFSAVTSTNNIQEWIDKEYANFSNPIVYDAIQSLESPWGEYLLDKFKKDMSYEEIAIKYNCNLNTAKTRVRTAIIKIRKKLFPHEPERVQRSRHNTEQDRKRRRGTYTPSRPTDPRTGSGKGGRRKKSELKSDPIVTLIKNPDSEWEWTVKHDDSGKN